MNSDEALDALMAGLNREEAAVRLDPPLDPLPTDPDAEAATIHALFHDPECIDAMIPPLASIDFHFERERSIFTAIEAQRADGADVSIEGVYTRLAKDGALDRAGGVEHLSHLYELGLGQMFGLVNAERVQRLARLRRAAAAGRQVWDEVAGGIEEGRVGAFLDESADALRAVALEESITETTVTFDEAYIESIDALQERMRNPNPVPGLASPWPSLDSETTGFHPGELWVIGARPSTGKSAFGMNVAMHAVKQGRAVLFMSLEMHGEMLMQRVFASEARIPLSNIRTGDIDHACVDRLVRLQDELSAKPVRMVYRPGATARQIRAEALAARTAWGRLDLVVVDYLQLMGSDKDRPNREQATADKSQALKALAGELSVPLIALAQLSRDSDKAKRRPGLSDLRESGAIEQDADGVLCIFRKQGLASPEAEFIIAKQRNGSVTDVPMSMIGRYVRFEERSFA